MNRDTTHEFTTVFADELTAPMEKAFAAFEQMYPSFTATQVLDDLRASDYARLDRQQQIYLDYTGGGLYAESQLRQHMTMLQNGVLGNPHSQNPTSLTMTDLADRGSWQAIGLVTDAELFGGELVMALDLGGK